jgi:hypothetical protein
LPQGRRRYCSTRCAQRSRAVRFRRREQRIDVVVAIEPSAFGVATSIEIAELFADDALRFAGMGLAKRYASTRR